MKKRKCLSNVTHYQAKQKTPDDHVFVTIECPDRPTISIDVMNQHGRRYLSVRVDGMTISSTLLDVEELPPLSANDLRRWCTFCGKERNWMSASDNHECIS